MQLLSVGHGLSTQLLVVDVEETISDCFNLKREITTTTTTTTTTPTP